jgi:hypothetical protein
MTSIGREATHVSVVFEPGKEEENDTQTFAPSATLTVPEKLNLDCELEHGGSITIHSKLEGDVRLFTTGGSLTVKKVRGHILHLEATGDIHVKELAESQSLKLQTKHGRIRAKRIHASDVDIFVSKENDNADDRHNEPLDDDDAGAMVDISSLYIIGDANVQVTQRNQSLPSEQRQAVRIKSHHGHVHVQTNATTPTFHNDMTGETLPVVDLCGVNGSCEVWIDNRNAAKIVDDGHTSCHVHFDSIVPDSVSVLHTSQGNVHVTMDRKVEADLRLLSTTKSDGIDVDTLLLDDNEDGIMADELVRMLQNLDGKPMNIQSDSKSIQLLTNAFTQRERKELHNHQLNCAYMDGWVENKTSEPDSRFDRKLRGTAHTTGGNDDRVGGGKIRLEGAYDQALSSFQTGERENTSKFARPLLAVVTPGEIMLETLSWMGNIARRYGMEKDTRDTKDLGRQATRRRRLDDTSES